MDSYSYIKKKILITFLTLKAAFNCECQSGFKWGKTSSRPCQIETISFNSISGQESLKGNKSAFCPWIVEEPLFQACGEILSISAKSWICCCFQHGKV